MTPASSFRSLVDSLVAAGATWKPVAEVPVLPPTPNNATSNADGDASKARAAVRRRRVHTLSNVRYGSDSPRQSLDLFFPDDLMRLLLLSDDDADDGDDERNDNDNDQQDQQQQQQQHCDEDDDEQHTTTVLPATIQQQQQRQQQHNNSNKKKIEKKYSVYVHIHGGGWSRGRKDSHFYGGPAVSQNAVAQNAGCCIAVAPGYRLGRYPEFVHDAAAALQWVRENLVAALGVEEEEDEDALVEEQRGGVILSGHSAGAHIASLLLLRHDCFLAPRGVPRNFVRKLVLLSGVYDLFRPLRQHRLVDAKNRWFVLAYVRPAFGSDEALRREASPLLLLEPDKDTSIRGSKKTGERTTIGQMLSFRKIPSSSSSSSAVSEGRDRDDDSKSSSGDRNNNNNETSVTTPTTTFDVNTSHIPPTLILNAAFDMGLQENGELMARAMRKHTDQQVRYRVIPKTDHASICWSPEAAREIRDFVQQKVIMRSDSGCERSPSSYFESEL